MSPLTKNKIGFWALWWQPAFECPSPAIPTRQPGLYLFMDQAAQAHAALSSSLCALFLMCWMMDAPIGVLESPHLPCNFPLDLWAEGIAPSLCPSRGLIPVIPVCVHLAVGF